MLARISESGSVTLKAVMIGVIVLLLLVPLTMLRTLINERSSLREQAYVPVAEGWGGNSVVGGPVLVVPTERYVIERNVRKLVRTDLYWLPAQLTAHVDMQLQAEPRYVGIYAVPVYLASLKFTGRFEREALTSYLNQPDVTYRWDHARLRVPLSESRSLREVRAARFGTQQLKLGPTARRAARCGSGRESRFVERAGRDGFCSRGCRCG